MKFDFNLLFGVVANLFGTAVLYFLGTEEREVLISGRKGTKRFFRLRIFFSRFTGSLTTIRKHKVCRTPIGQTKGKADKLAIKILIVYILFFLNSGHFIYLLSLLDSRLNLWQFQRYGLPNLEFVPYIGKHLLFITWGWNPGHPYGSGWFNVLYVLLGLAGLNKTVIVWFTHSGRARLIEHIIQKDPELPDNYAEVTQLNRDQVRVSYIGTAFDGDVFISKEKKKQLSGGTGHEIDVRLLPEHGKVLITFGSKLRNVAPPPVWDNVDSSLVRRIPNEFEGYVYAFRTFNIKVSKHVLKIGRCTDPEATLKTYRRGTPHLKKFVLCIRQSRAFNETLVHKALEKHWVPSEDGRGGDGEFFEDCDAMWRTIRNMLKQLPEKDLIEVPEGLLNEATFSYN